MGVNAEIRGAETGGSEAMQTWRRRCEALSTPESEEGAVLAPEVGGVGAVSTGCSTACIAGVFSTDPKDLY